MQCCIFTTSERGERMMLDVLLKGLLNPAALVLCITNLLFTFLQNRTDKLQNKFYIYLNVIIALNAICCVVSDLAVPHLTTSDTAYAVERWMEFLYFLLHATLCPAFSLYGILATGNRRHPSLLTHILLGAPFGFTVFITLLTPWTGWVYYYDEMHNVHRGWGNVAFYCAAAFYFVYSIIMLLFLWKGMNKRRRIALLFLVFVVVGGILLQFFIREARCELFAEALGLMGVMIAIESEDDRINIDSGFYNRKALKNDIYTYTIAKLSFHVICVKITNPEIILRATGSQNPDILAEIVADYLKSIVPRYHIYHVTSESFILVLLDSPEERVITTAKEMSARFEQPFRFHDTDIYFNAVIMTAAVPAVLHTPADVIAMADKPIPAKNKKKLMVGNELNYLLRRVAVEEAVQRGLDKGYFEVYYQPTYRIDGTIHGAEALLRLHDPLLGSVFPDEFIPVAEQIGLIDALDEFVFTEVCKFLSTGFLYRYGMDCINVNLSVMHCMQPDFLDHIHQTVEEFAVDKNSVNFEITESVAASDYTVLSSLVTTLKNEGYHFSMDDYGTGYSNMETIFALDFDVVKIDKSILWNSEKSEIGKILLENTVRMVRQMHRGILVEGVETQKQLDMLRDLDVDYIQGYFYSKPIPKDEFMEHLQKAPSRKKVVSR